MGDEQSYDDQFNDGLFNTTVHNGRQSRPGMWPRSVSEMRQHTVYGGQGEAPSRDVAHSNFMMSRQSLASAQQQQQAVTQQQRAAVRRQGVARRQAPASHEGFEYGRAFDPRRARARRAAPVPTHEGFEYGRAYDPRRLRAIQMASAREGFALDNTHGQRGPRQDRFYDPKSGLWTWDDKPARR